MDALQLGESCDPLRPPRSGVSHTLYVDIPKDFPTKGVRAWPANRGRTPTERLAGTPLTLPGRFPYVRSSAAQEADGATSTVGLASGPPGGRRAASALNRATRIVCHTGLQPGQSSRRGYPTSQRATHGLPRRGLTRACCVAPCRARGRRQGPQIRAREP